MEYAVAIVDNESIETNNTQEQTDMNNGDESFESIERVLNMNQQQQHAYEFAVTDGYGTYVHCELAATVEIAREQAISACGSHAHITLIDYWSATSIDYTHYQEYVERAIASGHNALTFSAWRVMGRPTK